MSSVMLTIRVKRGHYLSHRLFSNLVMTRPGQEFRGFASSPIVSLYVLLGFLFFLFYSVPLKLCNVIMLLVL